MINTSLLRLIAIAFLVMCIVVVLGVLISAGTNAQVITQTQHPTNTAVAEKTVDEVRKNIQVLKGMPDSQLVPTMNFMSASLGVRCEFCHVNKADQFDFASDEKPEKKTARAMIAMVRGVNKDTFKGNTQVSCFTCHRGRAHVSGVPPLPLPVPTPRVESASGPAAETMPTVDAVLAKYEAALGGASKLEGLKSRVMKGTYVLANGETLDYQVYQTAPDHFHVLVKGAHQNIERAYNGTLAWTRNTHGIADVTGAQLEELKRFGNLFRDIRLKTQFSRMVVTGKEKIKDRETYVVRATTSDNRRERLFFDVETGLLLRRIWYLNTPVGVVPEQIDFSDYRDVDGVKVPFVLTSSSLDPFNSGVRKFSEIHLNVPVDEGSFSKPAS